MKFIYNYFLYILALKIYIFINLFKFYCIPQFEMLCIEKCMQLHNFIKLYAAAQFYKIVFAVWKCSTNMSIVSTIIPLNNNLFYLQMSETEEM